MALEEEEGYTDVISMLTSQDQDIAAIPLSISDKHLSHLQFFHLHHQLFNWLLWLNGLIGRWMLC